MKILILGASVRAAAFSVARSGHVPLGADLFSDRDLEAIARCRRIAVEDYPERLFETDLIDEADAWFYTGALENHPALVDRLAAKRPLLGVCGPALSGVRNPFRLQEVLQREGFRFPTTIRDASTIRDDGGWLLKPYQSGGGRGIARWDGRPVDPASYLQRWIPGKSLSAIFRGDERGVSLIGMTEQGIGSPDVPFGYRSSLGPWPVSASTQAKVEQIGDLVHRSFAVNGLFGIDFVLADDEPWTIEVNPRYTASLEVLEMAGRRSYLFDDSSATGRRSAENPFRFVAKEVLFATADAVFDPLGEIDFVVDGPVGFDPPELADVPASGTAFRVGEPIATVFGEGSSIEACRLDLASKRSSVESRFLRPLPVSSLEKSVHVL